jgi:hypothetical protein
MSVQAEDASGDKQEFKEGQYVIDSTGRANDVYRRIQVALPFYEITGETPGYAASRGALTSASSICKRLRGIPGSSGSSTIDTIGVPAGACNIN